MAMKKYLRLLALFIILALLIVGLYGNSFSSSSEKTTGRLTPAKVIRIVDGDTIEAQFNNKTDKIRFIGVNCPESTIRLEPYGKEASNFTKKWLSGKNIYLEFDVGLKDKYQRILAYIWLEPPKEITEEEIRAKMFNAILLLEGFAQVMTVPPNIKYVDYFLKFQKEARENNKGLWALTEEKEQKPTKVVYVGNKRTKVFHHSWCKYVDRMSESNKVYFKSRQEAIDAGYKPCKVCKP